MQHIERWMTADDGERLVISINGEPPVHAEEEFDRLGTRSRRWDVALRLYKNFALPAALLAFVLARATAASGAYALNVLSRLSAPAPEPGPVTFPLSPRLLALGTSFFPVERCSVSAPMALLRLITRGSFSGVPGAPCRT